MNFTSIFMHGKLWIQMEELINFFEWKMNDKNNEFRKSDYVAFVTLSEMMKKALQSENVMTEEEYLKQEKEKNGNVN